MAKSARASLIIFSLFAACSGVKDIPGPAPTVTRAEALEISRAYTQLNWKGTTENVRHGTDADGIRVDTPDVSVNGKYPGSWWRPGTISKGMPYKWGGFDTPRSFTQRLKSDAVNGGMPAAAGDLGSNEKQAGGDAVVSRFAAGVDCSGFVSRCLRLSRPYSTRELSALCAPIKWEELKTGDIILSPGVHVLMFIQWTDEKKNIFLGCECGPLPVWRCGEHRLSRSHLTPLGYRPMRYRGMKD